MDYRLIHFLCSKFCTQYSKKSVRLYIVVFVFVCAGAVGACEHLIFLLVVRVGAVLHLCGLSGGGVMSLM